MTPAGDSSSADTLVEPLTFAYKRVQDTAIHLDLYPPCLPDNTNVLKPCEPALVPAVVYFHGGGLTVGNRRSWFPSWLHKRVVSAGIAFISADYRLLPPATGHDILADIKDVFRFLSEDINTMLQSQGDPTGLDKPPSKCPTFSIDANSIAAAGSSSGGLCAYLAAMHASPKPKVIISLYGMGGDFLTSHYLCPKTEVFFRGREMLDPTQFSEYLYPLSCDLAANPDSPLSYHPNTFHIPGYPSNPRMLLGRLYLQLGVYLDYYTGCHNPNFSSILRSAVTPPREQPPDVGAESLEDNSYLKAMVPAEHVMLFPQFGVTSAWPPTFLVHGSADTAVHARESRHMYALLRGAGVDATLRILEGREHSFDYEKTAEKIYGNIGGLFSEVMDFLFRYLDKQAVASHQAHLR